MGNSDPIKSKGKDAEVIGELDLPGVLAWAVHCVPHPSENQIRPLEMLAHLQVRNKRSSGARVQSRNHEGNCPPVRRTATRRCTSEAIKGVLV
jgi:hypothetical protein